MLPDHAGGTFEAVTMGDRTLARMLSDPKSTHKQEGNFSYYAAQALWGSSKSIGDTAGYEVGGWGATMGAEYDTKLGKFGGALSYTWGKDEDKGSDNKVNANQYGIAAHWRLQHEGLQVGARASYSYVDFDGKRFFRSQDGNEAIDRQIDGSWNGSLFSIAADASQELWAGSFYVRPSAGIEYYRLSEDGYEEEGGGAALDLTVDDRTSDELAVNALLVGGFEWGGYRPDDSFFRLEVEAGRRQIVGGSLGETTAHFADGDDFTLEPEDRDSGWVGRLRGIGGGYGFRIAGEVGAEEREEKVGLSARASLVLGL
jgi:hypothetical protein